MLPHSLRLVSRSGCTLLALCLTSAITFAQPGGSRDTFFQPAPDHGQDRPADELFPQGRLFPVGFFSAGGNRYAGSERHPMPEEEKQAWFRRLRADGVNLLAPQYELNDRALDDAKEHGFKAAYMLRARDAEGNALNKDGLRGADLNEVAESIRQQMREAMASHDRQIGWWYVTPEELRHWRKHEIDYLALAAKTIRETDPQQRPIWMYDPGHRDAAGLRPVAAHLDIVGKGMYTNYAGMVDQRVWCRWSIEQQNEAIAQANPQAISIAVPEMFRHPGQYIEALKEDQPAALATVQTWARHDAYAALVAGAKGMVVFSLRERAAQPDRGDLAFEGPIHTAYYESYAQVARELTGELNLGEVFLFGEARADVALEIVDGPATVTLQFRNQEPIAYPSLSMANRALGRDRYLILVNSSAEPIKAVLADLPYGDDIQVHDLFTGNRFTLAEGELEMTFPPLGVRAFRLVAP